MDYVKCPLCGESSKITGLPDDPVNSVVMIHCDRCGKYHIKDILRRTFSQEEYGDIKHLLSGWTREKYERYIAGKEKEIAKITRENINSILMGAAIPRKIGDKTDKIILYMFNKSGCPGREVYIPFAQDYSIAYASDYQEFLLLLRQLQNEGMIINKPAEKYELTFIGYQYAEALMARKIQSNTFFVAMWFDKQMDKAYEYIQHIEENTGFLADRVDKSDDYNGDINDAIIAKIRKSRFVVADFTGDRGGVYYEAGYAKALGREVIFTCRKDWFKNLIWRNGRIKNNGEEKDGEFLLQTGPHFDAEHENFIVWEDEEELKKKLIDRINATIL